MSLLKLVDCFQVFPTAFAVNEPAGGQNFHCLHSIRSVNTKGMGIMVIKVTRGQEKMQSRKSSESSQDFVNPEKSKAKQYCQGSRGSRPLYEGGILSLAVLASRNSSKK